MATRRADLHRVGRDEYLAAEIGATERHEWVDGVVYAMAGASKTHVATVTRVMVLLGPPALERGCLLGAADLLVETDHAFYYPDVVLSCDTSDDERIEGRPCLIVEVLSPSTKRADRHEKRDAYLALPSLLDYWIIDSDTRVVEAWTRTDAGWVGSHHTAAELLSAQCLGLQVPVVDIVGR